MLKAEDVMLKAEVAELRARLESNSHNSNEPPSSDGNKKEPVKPALPRSKGSREAALVAHGNHTVIYLPVCTGKTGVGGNTKQ